MPVKPCKRAIKASCHLPAPRGCSVQGMRVLKPPGTAAALVAPGSSSPSNSPSLFLELGLTRALHPSQHHLNNHVSAPCWAKGCLALSTPVPSPPKGARAQQIQLIFSTKFVFTLKYSPLALNLSHSGRDRTHRLDSSLTRTRCSYSFIIKSAKQTIAI